MQLPIIKTPAKNIRIMIINAKKIYNFFRQSVSHFCQNFLQNCEFRFSVRSLFVGNKSLCHYAFQNGMTWLTLIRGEHEAWRHSDVTVTPAQSKHDIASWLHARICCCCCWYCWSDYNGHQSLAPGAQLRCCFDKRRHGRKYEAEINVSN